jgi:DNA-binding NtrC family response regulator
MGRRVLIVDDDAAMCSWLEAELAGRGFEPVTVASGEQAIERLAAEDADVVLTDLNMSGIGGIQLCKRVAESRPDLPVVVITAFGSIETAVEAIRAGAYDYITKPVEIEAIAIALQRAVVHHALRDEVRRLRRAIADARGSGEIVGASAAMQRLLTLVDRVADSDATVLITGESGTGKELAARALHDRGRRRAGPFVPVNCSAVPEPLLESELFGHTRGAFTDAKSARAGLFVEAHGGTIFLDEIGELPLAMQPKLLRALQERRVRPVGSSTEVPYDARIVAATNRDLEAAVEERRFREDLYYRINVIHVDLPPLRMRGNDVLLLAQRFLQESASRAGKNVTGIGTRAAEKLLVYPWPGNVRELQNCVERSVALTNYEQLTVDDLPDKVREHQPSRPTVETPDPAEIAPLDEIERRYVTQVVEITGGNKTLAAKLLGLDRKTLHRKLERWADPTSKSS